MYDLTYYSIARPDLTVADISNILSIARTFNAENDITGCLLYYNNQFIQVLEGDRKTIAPLMSRIIIDKRHSNLCILAETEKTDRTFHDWTMAYRKLTEAELQFLAQKLFIENVLNFSTLAAKPAPAITAFWDRVQRLLAVDQAV